VVVKAAVGRGRRREKEGEGGRRREKEGEEGLGIKAYLT